MEEEEEINDKKDDDKMDEEKEKIDDDLKLLLDKLDNPEATINEIKLKEEEIIKEKDKDLLNKKKTRAKKLKQIRSGAKKKVKVKSVSDVQRIYNVLSKKGTFSDDDVRVAAREVQFQITQPHINFFVTLGEARANLKKYGIPGVICKNPFHIFSTLKFYSSTKIITNDINAWNCYYWYAFNISLDKGGLAEYIVLAQDSSIKDFSIVTNKPMQFKTIQSGYVQDYTKGAALICDRPLSAQEILTYGTAIENSSDGVIKFEVTNPSGNTKHLFIQYNYVLVVAPEGAQLNTILNSTATVKCVNSKNKLATGLKDLKVDSNLGSYLNVHEFKPTDFSPSCLFVDPPIEDPTMLIHIELETNSVYNYIASIIEKYETLEKIPFPVNSIFWDNLDSAIQLFAFIKLNHKVTEKVSQEISFISQRFYEFRVNVMAWKRMYSNFESIVLTFYDKITNKLTIDSIVALSNKVDRFLADFSEERAQSEAYKIIYKMIKILPGTYLMRNFVGTNMALDLVRSVSKLIQILRIGKLDKKDYSMSELFKAVGLACYQCLYNGDFAMIPKIRARCSFLGGLTYDTNKDLYMKNIQYLIDSYKDSVAVALKMKNNELDADTVDLLVKYVIENTIKKTDSDYLKENSEDIIKKIMNEADMLSQLRMNIQDLANMNTNDEIRANATFEEDDSFMTFLKTFDQLGEQLAEKLPEEQQLDAGQILDTIEIKVNKPKRMVFKKRLGPDIKKEGAIKMKAIKKKKGAVGVKRKKKKKIIEKLKKNKDVKVDDIENLIDIVIKQDPPEEEEKKV